MKHAHLGFASILVAAALGCGSSESEPGIMTVQASLSTSSVVTDNARAVAIGDDGSRAWAYLDRYGDFTLELPVGQSYRLVIANQLDSGMQEKVGTVVFANERGETEWLGANEETTVNLGQLHLAEDVSENASESLGPRCFSCKEPEPKPEANHDDDPGCFFERKGKRGAEEPEEPTCPRCKPPPEEPEGEPSRPAAPSKKAHRHKKCNICKRKAKARVPKLAPSRHPGRKCEDRQRGKHLDFEREDDKPCDIDPQQAPAPHGDGGLDLPDLPSGGGWGGADRDAGAGGGGGWGGHGGGGGQGGGGWGGHGGGSAPEGSPCDTSSTCEVTCTCVASTCVK